MQISNSSLIEGDFQYFVPDNTSGLGASSSKKANESQGSSSFADTVALSSAAQSGSNATITLNLHDLSNAQTLELEQTLGLNNAVTFTETETPSTVAQISRENTPIDQLKALSEASQFDASQGDNPGAVAFAALQNELLSIADSNGNVTVNAAKFYSFAAQDATNTYQ